MPKGVSTKQTDGRKNNKGLPKDPGEKRAYIPVRAKIKNHAAIIAKIEPIIKKMDQ